jgi:hypothetical protein
MRPRFLASLAVALLLVSGCAGPSDRPTAKPTDTSTAGPPGTGTACPYTVSASPATSGQEGRTDRRVDFGSLSDPRQAEFERMVSEGSVELDTLPETWSSPVLVDYRGETYYVVAQTC